jgi:hypothetical protein
MTGVPVHGQGTSSSLSQLDFRTLVSALLTHKARVVLVDRTLPPQSTNGMGGKETSDRAPTASARSSFTERPLPSRLLPGDGLREEGSEMKRFGQNYLYTLGFILALALSVYVFAFSN